MSAAKTMTVLEALDLLGACQRAQEWARTFRATHSPTTSEAYWLACESPADLYWILIRSGNKRLGRRASVVACSEQGPAARCRAYRKIAPWSVIERAVYARAREIRRTRVASGRS